MAAKKNKATRQRERQLAGSIKTANDEFFDAMLRHQIGLLRLSKSLGGRVRELLDASEADLRNAIRRALRRSQVAGSQTDANLRKLAQLRKLLDDVKRIRGNAYAKVDALFQTEMLALAAAEPLFVDGILKTVVPVLLDTSLPPAARLRAIVRDRPFEGRTMRQWAKKIEADDIARIEAQIKIGLTQGESLPAISRRITGTISLKGRNGVTEISRRNAEAISRTAVNSIANESRRAYHKLNKDILDKELYVATLDAGTTRICSSLDGNRYPIGEGPIPPLHFGCRSLRVGLLDAEPLGERPSKPVHQKQLLREFARQEDIKVPRRRADLPRGTKAAFDRFARQRTRQLIGRVPAKVSYQKWLGRQSAAFQDDVLGKTKGALFRRGKLPLSKFVDASTFKEIDLATLARTEGAAFRAAGLDPEDFLR